MSWVFGQVGEGACFGDGSARYDWAIGGLPAVALI